LRHGLFVPVDTDELDVRRSFEESFGVPAAAERGIDEDAPAVQRGQEQLDDPIDKDGFMVHIATVPGLALRWRPSRGSRPPSSR
jgi:hypothetical protein